MFARSSRVRRFSATKTKNAGLRHRGRRAAKIKQAILCFIDIVRKIRAKISKRAQALRRGLNGNKNFKRSAVPSKHARNAASILGGRGIWVCGANTPLGSKDAALWTAEPNQILRRLFSRKSAAAITAARGFIAIKISGQILVFGSPFSP